MRRKPSSIHVAVLVVVALAVVLGWSTPTAASEPFIGQIETFGFNFPPRGWAFCDGQLLQISQYTAVFSLLGTTFGGDGRTTFGLPDLRGRVAVHVGTGAGLSPVSWGQRGGAQTHTLSIANMPAHSHPATLRGDPGNGTQTSPLTGALANDPREDQYSAVAPTVDMMAGSVVTGNTGSGQSFGIRDPYLGIYHSIALQGIFPSRN